MCIPLTDHFNFRETVFAGGKFFHLFFLTNAKQTLLSQGKGRKPTCTKSKYMVFICSFVCTFYLFLIQRPLKLRERFPWTLTMSLIFEQKLRQAQSSLCVSPYHTPSMNLHANPQVSNSEVSLDEKLVQQIVRCLLWCAKLWQKYSLTHFTYERSLSCWSQEHTVLICFLYNTLFTFLSHFDYFWSLLCYCSLFVIVLFVIHSLLLFVFLLCYCFICLHSVSTIFSFCYFFFISCSEIVSLYNMSLVFIHYFPCLCYTAPLLSLTKSSKGNSYQYSTTELHR